MQSRVRHILGVTGLAAVIASALAMVAMTGSAVATGQALASDPLAAPLPSSFVSPALLVRDQEASFGSFSGESPQALTVDQATGDVYVLDPSGGKLWRFASNSAPDNFTAGPDAGTNSLTGLNFQGFPGLDQVAVDSSPGPAKGDIYVTESGMHQIKVFASTGEPLGTLKGIGTPSGSLGEDCGVAVDQSNGDVYVANRGYTIWRYTPTKSMVEEANYSGGIEVGIEPCQLAVANGSVYAKQWQEFPVLSAGPLEQYATSAFTLGELGFGAAKLVAQNVTGVATDPSTGDVYADFGNKISVYDPTGSSLYSFGSPTDFGFESVGVAVDGGGNTYVADPFHQRVDVYGPAFVAPPTATTGEASEIRHVKATLNGHLDLNGGPEVTDCHFDWGTTNAYGNTVPCQQGNSYSAAADVSATLTGLEPGKNYHFRLVVSAGAKTGTGSDQTFETVAVPIVHSFTAAFGASGAGDGQLSGNTGLAVDQASGDVYVADTQNHRVEKFDANGGFVSAFGWGVKDGKAEAETCTSGCQAGIAGSGAGQLAAPTFVAVDNSGGPSNGDVYVGDTANNTVAKYAANGNYLATNDGTGSGSAFGPLAGIAVDHNGNLWVYDTNADMREFAQDGTFVTKWNSGFGVTPAGIAVDSTGHLYIVRGNPVVEKLNSSGGDIGQVSGSEFNGPTTGLAVDQTTGELFIDDAGKTVRTYSGSCDPSTGPCIATDSFATGELNAGSGVAVNDSTDRVYVSDPDNVEIFDKGTPPDVTTGSASAPSATSATLAGTVGPNGIALTNCHFEYVSDAAFLTTGFTDLSSGGTAPCSPASGSIPADLEDHAVSATITGLDPAKIYHYRLLASNAQGTAKGAAALIPGVPLVETTGSPTRTAASARLDARLDPRGAATSYHFEYGEQGPCDSNPCTSTPPQPAGNGETYELVSQQIAGLSANTTYHYRIAAENGIPGGTAYGQDFTMTTRGSEATLSHGHFPGPPGSDRAWEQVNIQDTGGSQVNRVLKLSDSGERIVYAIDGGSPGSQYGGGLGANNDQYAERTAGSWENKSLFPKRSQAPGNAWADLLGRSDLSELYDVDSDVTSVGPVEVWRMMPGAPAQLVFSVPNAQYGGFPEVSADGSRVLAVLKGNFDPAHPVGPTDEDLYEVTSGTPHMIGLLPDGSIPPCGVRAGNMRLVTGEATTDSEGWITPDGSHAFFGANPGSSCGGGEIGLYVRDLVDSSTVQIAAGANLIRFTHGTAFFTTRESLVPGDSGGNDIYGYNIQDGSTECLTCATAAAGAVASNPFEIAAHEIAVSDDGSRIYFVSNRRILQGAASAGIYRLDVPGRTVAYVAPVGGRARVGDYSPFGNAINPDGSVFVFQSEDPALNAVNGAQNGGTLQDYRYDDRDRSLVCASCPPDGSLPRAAAESGLGGPVQGPSGGAVDDGGDFFFVTPTPLVAADQNTAPPDQSAGVGDDVYEWRDGRLLLVTDGQTFNVNGAAPAFLGASPSGRDVFFTQATQLTPDAIDSQRRLYDARVGGGFVFPKPPPPCSLEACQGTASPPPADGTPASLSFSGPGNQADQTASKQCGGGGCAAKSPRQKRCTKGKTLQRGKCVKKRKRKRAKRANHNHGGAK